MKTGIFYGSTTGTTANIARRIAKALNVPTEDVHDVAKSSPTKMGNYDLLVLGTSTWGAGEIQDDWYDFLDGAEAMALEGKRIAIFGDGDETMTDSFCSGMGVLFHRLGNTGASFIGQFPADVYNFKSSEALLPDGNMVGLALDEVNHPDLTDERIEKWVKTLK